MSTPVRAVIFDLDDTLFDCTGSLVDASRARAARALVEGGLPMSVEEACQLQRKLAELHGPHFLVFDEIGRRYGLDQSVLSAAYRAYNSEEVGEIEPYPDAVDTIRTLRRQGIKCLLLSVGYHRRQQAKLAKLGLDGEFDEVLINDLERGAAMNECMRYLLKKHDLRPEEVLVVGDRASEEIRVGNELGLRTAQILRGRFGMAAPRDEFEVPHYRIACLFQVPTILRLAQMGKGPQNMRIVAIGGGTGLPIVLEGCKAYSSNLTAVVAVTDSGRSSGKLREEMGMLAPGDVRNCLVAMSEPGEKERRLNELFQYRFRNGSLEGMSLGNLMIAAMADMTGSFEKGIRVISNLLNIRGTVLPSTVTDCHVCAELEDGTIVERETKVRGVGKARIKRVFLKPEEPEALQETVDKILGADVVVLGPGSLFTSVIPNILVPRVREALRRTRAAVYYVCNVMTQPGQTDGFTASDHYRALAQHLGSGDIVDCMVLNISRPTEEMLARYHEEGADLVEPDEGLEELGIRYVTADLVEDLPAPRLLWEKQDLLRHHPDKLADTIFRLYGDMEMRPIQSAG